MRSASVRLHHIRGSGAIGHIRICCETGPCPICATWRISAFKRALPSGEWSGPRISGFVQRILGTIPLSKTQSPACRAGLHFLLARPNARRLFSSYAPLL